MAKHWDKPWRANPFAGSGSACARDEALLGRLPTVDEVVLPRARERLAEVQGGHEADGPALLRRGEVSRGDHEAILRPRGRPERTPRARRVLPREGKRGEEVQGAPRARQALLRHLELVREELRNVDPDWRPPW